MEKGKKYSAQQEQKQKTIENKHFFLRISIRIFLPFFFRQKRITFTSSKTQNENGISELKPIDTFDWAYTCFSASMHAREEV